VVDSGQWIHCPFLFKAMTILTWAVRLIIFAFLLVFSVRNTEPITLRFLLDYVWEAPQVIVLLAFFTGGAILGVLSVVGVIFRQRFEISRLKRDISKPKTTAPSKPPALT
jgi:uncharacterized integral membrane protein